MPNDRIAELRAKYADERARNPVDMTAGQLRALLDCAEALRPFAAIPLEHIDTPETFGMDVLRARAALTKLNGDDHA